MAKETKIQTLKTLVISGFNCNEVLSSQNYEKIYIHVSNAVMKVYGLAENSNKNVLKERILELARDVSVLTWNEENGQMKTYFYENVVRSTFATQNPNALIQVVGGMTKQIMLKLLPDVLERLNSSETMTRAA